MAIATAAFILFNPVYSSTMGYIFNNGSSMPWLAETLNVSSDSKIYTFKSRPNDRWHDGVPLTSDDAIFTFELAKNVGNRNANPIYALVGKYIDRVDKIDNLTFRVILSQSYVPFLIYVLILTCIFSQNIY
jgi:ABC-type dipeptide transport system, periplasmic component